MLLPMMGFLFMLILAEASAGLAFFIFKRLRPWAPFVAFPPTLAGALSFTLCWSLALLGERVFHSEALGGVGFFGGYVGGGQFGAGLGLLIACVLRRPLLAQLFKKLRR